MKHFARLMSVGALLVVLAPAPAAADWFLTPFVGGSGGGDTDGTHGTYGVSAGFMGAGIFGFEVDFSYAPEFFEPENDDFDLIGDSNLTSLMANLIVGIPVGGDDGPVRPYASGGAGLMMSRVDDVGGFFDVDNNDFGVNLGAGVMGFFSDNVGIRGDVRYFRNLADDEEDNEFDISFGDFDFWRATAGVAFRF